MPDAAELIVAALRSQMRVCAGAHMSGAEAEDAARIALDALAGAGLVIVPAADLRTYAVETEPDFRDYARAHARLCAALPEETPDV